MGKFSHDGSQVEQREGVYDGEQPPPGTYNAVLVVCEEHTAASSGVEGTHWVFEFVDEPYAGFRGHVYTNDDSTLWKQDEVLYALGLIERGGTYSGTHESIVKKGSPVRVKTKYEKYEDEDRTRMTRFLPGGEAPAGSKKAKKKKDSDAEPF